MRLVDSNARGHQEIAASLPPLQGRAGGAARVSPWRIGNDTYQRCLVEACCLLASAGRPSRKGAGKAKGKKRAQTLRFER